MLILVLSAPVFASVVLGLFARRIGMFLPPAVSVVALTIASLVTASSVGFTLSTLGVTALAKLSPIARWGGWSASTLDATEPLPGLVSVLAGLLAIVLFGRTVRQILRSVADLRSASRLCAEFGASVGGLVIVDDGGVDAFAVSGFRTSRIVVSRQMLKALPPAERRVLLAHEAAHVRTRHHVYVQLADVAAAANPLLRPVSQEVRVGVERWADELAVDETGDRRVAARSLARAGLARMQSRGSTPSGSLAAADGDLSRRVHAMLAGRPRPRPAATVALSLAIAALIGTSAVTAYEARQRVAHADWVYDHR